ncbi:MAG: Crp/Fnr family transcriptional regulator [Flavobacteriales bacterium]|nr:Crp/Fnr family transcriptional regulator [Flavobacteriales bacterium]
MENEIIKYLSKYISLSEELTNLIIESTVIKKINKGTILLKEGDISNESYLVLNGCIRSFIVQDGDEKSIEFYTEEQAVLPLSYGKKIASEHFLECIEDTIVTVNTPEHEKNMFKKFPQFDSVCRVMSEVIMSNFQNSFAFYRTATPEDRYLKLLNDRPDLAQRVPQYQLASYLGVKPETLSRIRKRLSKK